MTHMRNLFFVGVLFMAPNALGGDIDVMTQNQYLGADLAPVIEAAMSGDLTALNNAVIEALEQVAANQTAERMDAQAALIADRRPHVVGLQEVYTFLCDDPFGTGACQDQRVAAAVNKDFLELTQAALGGAYASSAAVLNLSATVPFDLYGFGMPAFLTVIDRDVILTRSDIVADPVEFAGGHTGFHAGSDHAQHLAGQLAGHPHLLDFVFGFENDAHRFPQTRRTRIATLAP